MLAIKPRETTKETLGQSIVRPMVFQFFLPIMQWCTHTLDNKSLWQPLGVDPGFRARGLEGEQRKKSQKTLDKQRTNCCCKDQFWLGPQTRLGFGPTSLNNKFIERERKN